MKKRIPTCVTCGKTFKSWRGRDHHTSIVHGTGRLARSRLKQIARTKARDDDDEPSIASQFVDAQIRLACGERIDDWLLEMLP